MKLIHWVRELLHPQSRLEQVIIIGAVTLIALRFIFPVWHIQDGYPVRLYPLREKEICLSPGADCQWDRSRTAIEAANIALAAFVLIGGGRIIRKR